MISKVLVSNSAMSDEAPKIAMPRQVRAVIPAASGEELGMALHLYCAAGSATRSLSHRRIRNGLGR